MEDKNVENTMIPGETPTSSRWNPTKEQVGMLEGWYRQGMKTPSAEQIQQITNRLKAYGHIEGKNVFYWFQNHKARQRQKQKQQSMVLFNRYLHSTTPVFAPPSPTPCPNVICSPFYLPQSGDGFYWQNPKVLLPNGVKRRSRTDTIEKTKEIGGGAEYKYTGDVKEEVSNHKINSSRNHETLALFPLHPTGFSEGRRAEPISSNTTDKSSCTALSSPYEANDLLHEGSSEQSCFNFFVEYGS